MINIPGRYALIRTISLYCIVIGALIACFTSFALFNFDQASQVINPNDPLYIFFKDIGCGSAESINKIQMVCMVVMGIGIVGLFISFIVKPKATTKNSGNPTSSGNS